MERWLTASTRIEAQKQGKFHTLPFSFRLLTFLLSGFLTHISLVFVYRTFEEVR
jgi:hypothetical protein